MDVNSNGWSQAEFVTSMAKYCSKRLGTMCERTEFACKDYLCPVVKSAKDIKEVRSNFAQQPKERHL
jgi:hypothetical protein